MLIDTLKISKYLDEFAQIATPQSSYVKIPYQTYRRFRSCLNCYETIYLTIEAEMSFMEEDEYRFIFDCGVENETFRFNSQDLSFGTFLYKIHLKELIEEVNKYMNYTTSTSVTDGNLWQDRITTGGSFSGNIKLNSNDWIVDTNTTIATNTISWDADRNSVNIGSDGTIKCKTLKAEEIIIEKKEEEKEMKGFNFDFGAVDGNKVHMSMYGMAIKNAAGTWVSYDESNEDIVDVDILNFDASKFMYKMPVAIKDVKIGDILIHNRVPMFVTHINGTTFTVVDVYAGEEKIILPTKNMFGFNFVTKVVSFIDMGGMSADTPFGNMLPLMLMGDGKDIDPMMLMMMMGNGAMDMSNPMMMYFMMKDSKDNDMLPLLMMMAPKAHTGNCGKPSVEN